MPRTARTLLLFAMLPSGIAMGSELADMLDSTTQADPSGAHQLQLRVTAGANWISPISIGDIGLPDLGFRNIKIDMQTGVAGQVDLGWSADRFLGIDLASIGVELSAGIAYNRVDRVRGTAIGLDGVLEIPDGTTSSFPLSGWLLQVPLMIGPTISLPIIPSPDGTGLYVRLGASFGGVLVWGSLDGIDGLSTSGSDFDVTWAYALSASLDWHITDRITAGLSYRFLATGSVGFSALGVNDLIRTSTIQNSQFLASIGIRF
jgi:hypothetical protein